MRLSGSGKWMVAAEGCSNFSILKNKFLFVIILINKEAEMLLILMSGAFHVYDNGGCHAEHLSWKNGGSHLLSTNIF